MKFLDAFGTVGGQLLLIAFLWLTLLVMVFTLRMRGVELDPEGRAFLFETSKILLVLFGLRLGLSGFTKDDKDDKVDKENTK